MMTVKKPNMKGPRYREKWITVATANVIKEFKEKYPEYADLEPAEFKKIVKTFNKVLAQAVVDNRNGIELPEGLGHIFMGCCPRPKGKNINFPVAREKGIAQIHRNSESDNKLLKIFYTNNTSKIPFQNKEVWSFKASTAFRKIASAAFKEDYTKYVVVDPMLKISAIFKRNMLKDYGRNVVSEIPEGYDEFKM